MLTYLGDAVRDLTDQQLDEAIDEVARGLKSIHHKELATIVQLISEQTARRTAEILESQRLFIYEPEPRRYDSHGKLIMTTTKEGDRKIIEGMAQVSQREK